MSKPVKERIGRISPASWFWLWSAVSLIAYELVMLAIRQAGGALSHVVWWANAVDDGLYSVRWVLVTGPIFGFLAWLFPHFGWGVGNGLHLALAMVGATAVLAVVSLIAH